MNIYTFDIFTNHWIAVEEMNEPGKIGFFLYHLEIGPLNLPESFHLEIVKEAVRNISSMRIPSNWWTGFSSWEDYFGLLRTGSKLPIHSVVMDVNRKLERIKSGICTIDHINENGDISIRLHERFPTLMKGYQITARRKRISTLKQLAAYNVAKCITSNSDVHTLHIPCSLYPLVSMFLNTYSGDYMNV